jgi:hypothetical protein
MFVRMRDSPDVCLHIRAIETRFANRISITLTINLNLDWELRKEFKLMLGGSEVKFLNGGEDTFWSIKFS